MPKLDKNDAWVKGADFIDLANLGKKVDNNKSKEAPVYINIQNNQTQQVS